MPAISTAPTADGGVSTATGGEASTGAGSATGARPPTGSRTVGTVPASEPVAGTGVTTAPPDPAMAPAAADGDTRRVWPTWIWSGSVIRFHDTRSGSVTPYWRAMPSKVSPGRTV